MATIIKTAPSLRLRPRAWAVSITTTIPLDPGAQALAMSPQYFNEQDSVERTWLMDIQCSGDETDLMSCEPVFSDMPNVCSLYAAVRCLTGKCTMVWK